MQLQNQLSKLLHDSYPVFSGTKAAFQIVSIFPMQKGRLQSQLGLRSGFPYIMINYNIYIYIYLFIYLFIYFQK